MLKNTLLLASFLLLSAASHAAAFNLRCLVKDDKADTQNESWIAIDVEANYMRVSGSALELSVTNEYYSSKTKPVAGFTTIRRIDRSSGEIVVTELYQSSVAWQQKGTCERADPPKAKF
jgi:hypothetical protein